MTLNFHARRQFELGAAAYIRRDYKRSAVLFSRAITFDRKFAPGYVYRGSACLKNGQVAPAMADFERAIQLDPEFALAYHMRALAHEKRGNYAKAYRDFDTALHLDPYFSSAYCGRDSVLARQNTDDCHDEAEIINHLNGVRLQSTAS
jgi:tetratricopeptide (TPR) repeat protein